MRRIISICLILCFLLPIISFADDSLQQKMFKYEQEKKDGWTAALIPLLLVSSGGHAYAGDWPRGLLFLAGRVLSYLAMSQTEATLNYSYYYGYYYTYKPSSTASLGALAFLALYIWEPIDAYQTAERHNKDLKKAYGLDFSLRENNPVLQMSYKF